MEERPDVDRQDEEQAEEAPPGGPETSPRGNQEPDAEDVERGQEKLDQISGN